MELHFFLLKARRENVVSIKSASTEHHDMIRLNTFNGFVVFFVTLPV